MQPYNGPKTKEPAKAKLTTSNAETEAEAEIKDMDKVERWPEIKEFYLATNAILPQLGPVIDVLLNLNATVADIAGDYDVAPSDLMEWVTKQLPQNVCVEDEDEDEED